MQIIFTMQNKQLEVTGTVICNGFQSFMESNKSLIPNADGFFTPAQSRYSI